MKNNYFWAKNKGIVSILSIIFTILVLLLGITPKASAAVDQWASITPSVPNGTVFNTVAVIDTYVYVGTNNGIYRSDDSGVNWANSLTTSCGGSACNVTSVAIGWIYDSAYVVNSNSPIFAGTSNGGIFKSTIGNPTWSQVNAGLTDTNISDIEIDQFLAIQGITTNIYAATPSGVFRSDDEGLNWSLKDFGMEGEQVIKLSSDLGGALIYALTNTNKLYSSALFSSSGTDENWILAYDGGVTTLNDINVSLGLLNWLATNPGILKSDDMAVNWTSKNNGLSAYVVKNVIGDFADQNIAYAALSGGGVYRTTNEALGTPQWLPINKNLSDLNIKEVKTNPTNSTTVYAINGNGVYQLLLSDAYADLTPPSDINDLATNPNTDTSILLTWTASGDDLIYSGSLVANDVRYSTSPITSNNWASATQAIGEPTSDTPGNQEFFIVQNLIPNTNYYFAVKAIDEAGNESALSNMASIVAPDITAPIITLTGNSPVSVEKGAIYTDAGASALDNLDGNITANIIITNQVNTTATGTYAVKYNLTDSSGNAATEVIRTVNVVDTTAPILTEITKVSTPTNDNTPDYTFNSNEVGAISYSGGCASATTVATSSNNTITFNTLTDGVYSSCKITVTDASGNISSELNITSFTINTAAPILTEITKVSTPTNDNTPDYTFNSNEVGAINYSGGCASATTVATSSNNTITFNTLTDGVYSSCKITVTDASGNISSELNITSFTINTAPSTPPPANDNGGGGSTPPPQPAPATILKLVKSSSDNKIYIIENGKKRLISNDKIFTSYGYKLADVKIITPDELNKYANDINLPYADGTLLKATSSPKVYVIKNGKKSVIPSETVFKSYNYSWDKIIEVGADEISGYGEGEELKLAENSLIMSDAGPRIYLIKDNKRYWVATDEIFKAYGLKRENILKVDVSLVKSYEDGGELKLSASNQIIILSAEYKSVFSYGKPRLGSLTEEQKLAIELRQKLEKNYSKKQLTGINGKNWNTITNSYIYGGYPVEAIVKAIKFGGKTVHPAISYEKWKGSKDYLEYIKK
jgi:hypothetical protein